MFIFGHSKPHYRKMRCGRRGSLAEAENDVIFGVFHEANNISNGIVTECSETELKIKVQSVLFVRRRIKRNVRLCSMKQPTVKRIL